MKVRFWQAMVLLFCGVGLLVGCADQPGGSAPPATTAPTPTSAGPAGGGPDRLTFVATGDVLLHERLWNTARRDGAGRYDFDPLLAGIKPLVSGADLAVCHLETPLAKPGGPYSGYPAFDVPPQIAPALKRTGFDACTTASNHSFDRGATGVERTLNTLDRTGLAHAGTARSPKEAATPTIVDVRGVKVALLSYTFGFNGIPYPNGETWRANKLDRAAIHAEAKRAREAGAEIVIVACHWGDEYRHTPNAEQLAVAPDLVADSNIDLVIGHHAHVVQPLEKIGPKWVAYGLGNMVAAHREPQSPKSEGLLARFTFSRGPDGRWSTTKAEYAGLLVTDPMPVRLLNTRARLAAPGLTAPLEARLRKAVRRTDEIVNRRGAAQAGATAITP